MAKKKTVKIELIFDSKGAVTGVKTVDGEILELGKSAEKTQKRLGKLSDKIKLGLTAALVGAVAITKQSVRLAGVQQRAEQKLEQALRNTGDASEESATMLKGLASELQRTSNFGDEMILTAQAMLLSFGEVGGAKGAALLTSRLADVAAGVQKSTGDIVDLNTIAAALGKSLSGGAGSLKEYGISLTKTQEEAFNTTKGLEKVRLLTEILDSNFKGLAAATRDPFIQATNAVDDLKEALGSRLRPELEKTAEMFTQFVQDEQTVKFVEKISESLLFLGQDFIETFQFKGPIAINNFRLKFSKFAQGFLKVNGDIFNALFNPVDFFNGTATNPFQDSINQLDSLRANAHDALVALVLLRQQQKKELSEFEKRKGKFGNNVTPSGGPEDPVEKKSTDRLTLLQQERDELIKQGEVTERLIRLQTQIAQIESERKFVREASIIQHVDGIGAEIGANEELIASWERRRDAVLDAALREIDADNARRESKEALLKADEAAIAQNIVSADLSIQTAGDAANAVISSIRQIIQAKIAETIAKSIASIPFPANLVLGGVAAAGINLLFNKLIPQFADGVTGFGGGMALVGERGPELVSLPQGSNVITNENTEKLLSRINSGGSQANDFSPALRELKGAIVDTNRELGDRIERMQVQIDYFGLNDGLQRHNGQQSSIGGS